MGFATVFGVRFGRSLQESPVFFAGPFALGNLKPDTEYITKILAMNRAGNSEYTDSIAVRTKPTAVNNGAAAAPSSPGFVLHRILILSAAAVAFASLLLGQ